MSDINTYINKYKPEIQEEINKIIDLYLGGWLGKPSWFRHPIKRYIYEKYIYKNKLLRLGINQIIVNIRNREDKWRKIEKVLLEEKIAIYYFDEVANMWCETFMDKE